MGKPIHFIEADWEDSDAIRGLRYLIARYPRAEAVQISAAEKKDS